MVMTVWKLAELGVTTAVFQRISAEATRVAAPGARRFDLLEI